MLVAVPSASAITVPNWPTGTKALVQYQEGNQNLLPEDNSMGLDTLAHGYGVLPQQNNTYVGPQLKVRLSRGFQIGTAVHAVTLLDFTGDSHPDILVDTVHRIYLNSQAPWAGRAFVYDVSQKPSVDRCVAVPPRSEMLFEAATKGYNDTSSNYNSVAVIPLDGLLTAAGLPFSASALENPPRMLTLATNEPNPADGPPSPPVRDTLPSAAAAAASTCPAEQFSYDFSKATYRYPAGSTPAAAVTHTDPADNQAGFADLKRVSVQQYSVEGYQDDVVANRQPYVPRTFDPAELTIDFASADDVSSDTWLFPGTWNRSTTPTAPSVLIRTEGAGNGRVKVTVLRNLPSQTFGGSSLRVCLRTNPVVAAGDSRSFTVPLAVLPSGDRRLSVSIDDLVPNAGADFRFHTISDPGQLGGQAPIDHVPLFAGYSLDGTLLAGGCDAGGGNPGAQVHLDRSFVVGPSLPKVELQPNTTTPVYGEEVTYSLGQTAAGTRRCALLKVFSPNDCSILTASYTQDATAYLAVDTATGPWDQTQVDIKLKNRQPTATISRVGTTPAQGTDGSFAIVQGAAVSIPLKVDAVDQDPGTAFTYRWTLNGAASPVSTASTYTPTFAAPGTYTVRAFATDNSGDSATETSPAATMTITVVRSPQGAIEIVRPARLTAGQPFDIEAQTLAGTTGYSALTWQWDLDGDGSVTFDPARTTRQLTGIVFPDVTPSRLVRVRATDAGGRTADATISLNVRRVNDTAPTAKFNVAPASPTSGAVTTFDASATVFNSADGTAEGPVGQNPTGARFRWSFGDGTAEVVTTSATVSHTFAGSGRPKVSLLVEDLRRAPTTVSDPAEKTLVVTPGATDANAPVAKLVRQDPPASEPVFAGRPVTVTASASVAAPGHAPLTYAFDLDGNGSFEQESGSEPTVTFTPATAGALIVGVRVTDDLGSIGRATLPLGVNPEPVAKPTAQLAGPAEVVLDGVTVNAAYDANGSKGNNLDPSVNFRWDLDGNGSFETPTGADPKVTATFNTPGEKTVKVRVTDRYGNTADAEKTTVVRSAADIAAGCTGKQSFREVTYENARLRGCVVAVKRPSAGQLYVISGKTVSFNGLRMRETTGKRPAARPFADCTADTCKDLEGAFNAPSAPWSVVLDPSDGSLRSNAATALRASGVRIDLPLLSGPLDVTLPKLAAEGFTLGTPPDADLGGFPLGAGATLKFPAAGETSVTVIVGLPAIVGGITGQATIRVTASGGVVLDDLKVNVGEIALGKLSVGNLSFAYNNEADLWQGGGSLTLPSPKPLTIGASLAIQRNRFKSITAEVSGINQPIAQAIYLQAIRAGVSVDPLDLTAGITVSAGPAIKNKKVVSLDGDLRLKFPSPAANYYLFALTGKLKLADFQLATAFAQFSSNGFFEMGGGIDARVGPGYAKAYIKGWMTANAFNIDGDASVGVTLGGSNYDLFGGHVTLSTTGFGACGGIPVIGLEGGFGKRWDSDFNAFWGCDLSPYRATRPADAPATLAIRAGAKAPRTDLLRGRLLLAGPEGHLLRIPEGQKKAQLSVTGTTAPPRVSLVDGQGKVLLSTPADGADVLTKQMLVQTDREQKTTTILWKAPPAGKVYVVSQAGSSPVAKVDLALPAPKRKLGVTVGGKGRSRTLSWNISPKLQPGEQISLAEEGTAAGTELVSTSRSKGSVPFTPQGGAAGKRSIMATISAGGLPAPAKVAATYVAPPPPAPARPASVRLVRNSSGVVARWTPGKGGGATAAKWRVLVRVADTGRKQLLVLKGSQRQARIADVNPSDAVSVSVTGADLAGVEGPARRAVVKAGLRGSFGRLASPSNAVPRNIVIRRLAGGRLRVTWKTGPAFLQGWSVRVSAAKNGRRKGPVTLLRTAGDDRSVEFVRVPKGDLRVSVIGRRFEGSVTRKDVRYTG